MTGLEEMLRSGLDRGYQVTFARTESAEYPVVCALRERMVPEGAMPRGVNGLGASCAAALQSALARLEGAERRDRSRELG